MVTPKQPRTEARPTEPVTGPGDDGFADGESSAPATVAIESDGVHALLQGFVVEVTSGPDAGKRFRPTRERTVIGTHPSADLVLKDRTVSRFHCEIVAESGRVLLRDLGSRNGTAVDGVPVLVARLVPGARIALGRTLLAFQLDQDRLKLPLAERGTFGIMVGRSVAMRRVFALLGRAAESDATVLIEGETGTGKEAVAESIHRESARKDGPFVIVDCGAIPAALLESELFGHERGAFTGAVARRLGAFEEASGGTIFLDEIGELDPELQPKLLRVLERKEIKRVGSSHYAPVDVRVVAATNRGLRGEVNAKRFRSDLYYRLAVVEITIPPLRERQDDVPLLVSHLLARLGAESTDEAAALLSERSLAALARHAWPGNVRELRNYVERTVALREHAPPLGSDAPTADVEVDLSVSLAKGRDRVVESFERRYIRAMLELHGGSVVAAARAAGVDRTHLHRLMSRVGVRVAKD